MAVTSKMRLSNFQIAISRGEQSLQTGTVGFVGEPCHASYAINGSDPVDDYPSQGEDTSPTANSTIGQAPGDDTDS